MTILKKIPSHALICATTSKKTFITPNIYSSVAAEDISSLAEWTTL
jgi:hypothetical protein